MVLRKLAYMIVEALVFGVSPISLIWQAGDQEKLQSESKGSVLAEFLLGEGGQSLIY